MTTRSLAIALALSFAALVPMTAFSQDPPAVPAPEDMEGDEIFTPSYRPVDPEDLGVPLEVGRPLSGVVTGATPIGQAQLDPRFLSTGPKSPLPVPLRRSVQRQLKLPKFKPPRSTARSGALLRFEPKADAELATMRVHYVNVGQGAGAIVEFPRGCGIAVIDTGGEFLTPTNGGSLFATYLDKFFDERPHLNRTIDALYSSHPHKDHIYGLSYIIANSDWSRANQPITVRNLVDNGQSGIKGSLLTQADARAAARKAGAAYVAVRVQDQNSATGSTNSVIDPFNCRPVDPVVTAFWGSRNEMVTGPGQPQDKYGNPNEHSVVVKIEFDKASFLFTGDLMKQGLADMVADYSSNKGVLEADVYQAGHHGADNGTSTELLKAVKPRIAIISVGDDKLRKNHTAWDHGHPRLSTLALLQGRSGVRDSRTPVTYWGATGDPTKTNPDVFKKVTIKKAIYATGWEGNLIVEARSDGTYKVIPERP